MSGGKRQFGDIAAAMAMRDLTVKIAESVVKRLRPDTFSAEVYSYNIFSRRAMVRSAGMEDDEPLIEVSFTSSMQPNTAHTDLNLGTIVEVEGTPGNYWIKRILSGEWRLARGRFVNARFNGGLFDGVERESQYVVNPNTLPAVGNTVHLGTWSNKGMTLWSGGKAQLKVRVHHELFTSMIKTYDVLLADHTEGQAWKTLAPDKDSGTQSGNDFSLEIKIEPEMFSLRVRRLRPGVYATGGYYADVRVLGQNFFYDDTNADLEEFDPRPTEYYGRDEAATDELAAGQVNTGPYSSGIKHTIEVRQQAQIVPPDMIFWNGTSLRWTGTWKAIGLGVSDLSSTGHLSFAMPAAGTLALAHGWSGGYGLNTDANGFGMGVLGPGTALYVEPIYFANGAVTDSARYHMVAPGNPFKIPSHWIMLAVMNPVQTNGNSLLLGNGETRDHWRSVALSSGITAPTSAPASKLAIKCNGGRVIIQGQAVRTAAVAAGVVVDVGQLPNGSFFGPAFTIIVPHVTTSGTTTTGHRILIRDTGLLSMAAGPNGITAGQTVYFDAVTWDLEPRT